MISEQTIEKQIEKVINYNEVDIDPFVTNQQEFLSYIKSEIAPSLIEEELKLFLFCISVIYNSVTFESEDSIEFDMEEFENYDEKNWGTRDKTIKFEKSKDMLFDGYKEEDLLAFVEDLISDDEENVLTDVGKEIIFLNAKSYIDTLCQV